MMEIYKSLDDALREYPDSYIAFAKMGDCMVCKKYKDLRCGTCMGCGSKVSGEPMKGGHRLWETSNPENTWYVGK